MGLFRRLFSSDYRRAVAAEAAGEYSSAAESYALCGERTKVAEMHLALASAAADLDQRIHSLKTALGFIESSAPKGQRVCHQLGEALVQRATSLGEKSVEGQRALGEAATLLEDAALHE